VFYAPPFCVLCNLIDGETQGQINHSKPSTALFEALKRLFCGTCEIEIWKLKIKLN
jgi:hypothetical protein